MSRFARYFLQSHRPKQWDLVKLNSKEHNVIRKLDSIGKYRKNVGIYKEQYKINYGNEVVDYTMTLEIIEPDDFGMNSRSMDVKMYRERSNNPEHKKLVHVVYLPDHNGAEEV